MEASQPAWGPGRRTTSRYRTLGDIRLFLVAFRLARHAQGVTQSPLPEVVDRLLALKSLPCDVDPGAAWVAAIRGSRYRARWSGGLDTCLIRALVAGTLLSDRPDVMLHIGFRPDPTGIARADGHAWLAVGEATLGLAGSPEGECHDSAWRAPVRRRENGR